MFNEYVSFSFEQEATIECWLWFPLPVLPGKRCTTLYKLPFESQLPHPSNGNKDSVWTLLGTPDLLLFLSLHFQIQYKALIHAFSVHVKGLKSFVFECFLFLFCFILNDYLRNKPQGSPVSTFSFYQCRAGTQRIYSALFWIVASRFLPSNPTCLPS